MLKARHTLDVKKKQIEENLLGMVAQVKDALEQAIVALKSGDQSVCKAVIGHDAEINQNRRVIEHDGLMAIALHQPVAHDLREIVAATRIAGELERTADYASAIAAIVMQMDSGDLSEIGLDGVLKMHTLATGLLDDVLAAYLERDAEKAKTAAKLDNAIDAEQANLIDKLFATMQSNPDQVPNASRMLWISHHLERCGDRATNIAEQVVFMMDSEVVELD